MNEEVVIETERLLLRSWKLEDANDLVEGLNNLEVSKWMAFTPYPYTKKNALDFINYSLNCKDINLAIVLKDEWIK